MPSNKRLPSTGDPAVDRALELLQHDSDHQPIHITTGAGIAVAGAWLAGSAVTITIMLITFVFDPMTKADQAEVGAWDGLFLIFLIAWPLIAAYSITKVILSKD